MDAGPPRKCPGVGRAVGSRRTVGAGKTDAVGAAKSGHLYARERAAGLGAGGGGDSPVRRPALAEWGPGDRRMMGGRTDHQYFTPEWPATIGERLSPAATMPTV